MVGTFVRLKLRLMRNRLRRSGPMAVIAFVAVWLGAAGLGTLGAVTSFFAIRLGPGALQAIWVFLSFAWIVVPLIAAALDDTVEPARLQLLPIPNVQLATGLLAAAALGPGALASILLVFGGVGGLATSGIGLIGQTIAGATMVIWCLVSARVVTTFLSDVLRSRRGRDLVAIVGPLIGFSGLALQSLTAQRAADGIAFPTFLWVLPPGALARSIEEFAIGDGSALLFLVYGVLATVGLVLLFGLSLVRLVTRSPRSGPRAQAGSGSLMKGIWSRLSGSGSSSALVAAVAAKEMRGLRRDPRLRSQFIGLGIALLVVATGVGRQLLGTDYAPLVAVAGAFIGVNATGFNLFGMDNGSFWAYLASGVPWRSVILGKNVAILLVAGVVTLVMAIIGLLVGGNVVTFLVAIFASAAVALIWISIGNNVSVLGAFAMPDSNLFGSRNLPGGVFLPSILGMLTAGALTTPVAALIALPWLLHGPVAGLVGSVIAVAFAVLIYRFSLTMASGQIESRTPRLLEILDGR